VSKDAPSFNISQTFANRIEVVLFKGQKVLDRLRDKILTALAGMDGKRIQRNDLCRFELDLELLSHEFYLPLPGGKSQMRPYRSVPISFP
jgi:hypothetical protein